jgi:small GTP-binding protein
METGPREYRVIFLGDSAVGKTALFRRLMSLPHNPGEESTIRPSSQTYIPPDYEDQMRLQVWDTAGQERYRALGPLYYKGAHAGVLVYDITSSQSFADMDEWLSVFRETAEPNAFVVIVGNKLDLEDHRTVAAADAQDWAASKMCHYFETSAKAGTNLGLVFEDIAEGIASASSGLQEVERAVPMPPVDGAQAYFCC